MVGRNRYTRKPHNNHHVYPPNGSPRPMSPDHIVLEQELEMQHHEIRRLLGQNRRLVEDRVTLLQELGVAREHFRRMNISVIEIQKENELHSRQLIESALKLEADIEATEPSEEEVMELHEEVKRLNSVTCELYGQVQTLTKDLAELQDENKKLHALKNEFQELHKELMHASDAIGYEKKASSELLDQKRAMERNLASMAREIERLRALLSNPDIKSWSPDGSYKADIGTYDSTFLHPYGDAYGRNMDAAEYGPFYGSGSGSTPWAELEKSQMTDR